MPLTPDNLKLLIEWLGPHGAAAGLEKGDVKVEDLRALLEIQGVSLPDKMRKSELVTELVFASSKKIDKSISQLLKMSSDELLRYFKEAKPSRREVLEVLRELKFQPGKEAQKNLYKYAARQIGETGMFERVSKGEEQ